MSGCDTFRGARLVLFLLLRRPDIVAMGTAVAMNRRGYRAHRLAKPLRYPDFLPGARIERRENRASFVLVFSRQIQLEPPVNSTKQNLRLQERSRAVAGLTRPMLGNQQFVCPTLAQHFDSHQHRRHYDGMHTIHSNCLHWMQALDGLAIFLGEGDVSPEVSDRPTRLQSTHHIAFCQMLVFQADSRMGKDPSFFQHPQPRPGEPQPQYILQAVLLHVEKTLLSYAECRMPIGQPTAARIISFVQPA